MAASEAMRGVAQMAKETPTHGGFLSKSVPRAHFSPPCATPSASDTAPPGVSGNKGQKTPNSPIGQKTPKKSPYDWREPIWGGGGGFLDSW